MAQKKQKPNNIVLIGMSGVGKSTVGKVVAEKLHWTFCDIDRELETIHKISLQEILDHNGASTFTQIEGDYFSTVLKGHKQVIAPGGSIIYATHAMSSIPATTIVCYLSANCNDIQNRIKKENRGIVGLGDKSFQELFNERVYWYEKYADVIITTDYKQPDQIAEEILSLV